MHEQTYFMEVHVKKEVWARTKRTAEEAFHWEMTGQTATVTLVIRDTLVDQVSQ